jgi:DNA-binding transcriptional ArsR family regulator
MSNVSSALTTLVDPTRRAVFERLAAGEASVGELAQGLPVSQPAVSQHLKVLREAGLVRVRAEGTRRMYQIDPAGLGPLRAWLDQFWDEQLASYRAAVEEGFEGKDET